jgi:hypothetical protein
MKAFRIIFAAVGFNALLAIMMVSHGMSTEIVSADRHLVREGTGVVYDTQSGLEWFPGPDQSMSWEKARRWVTKLDAVGGGWRMPTRRELDGLSHIGDGVSNITFLLHNSGFWIWAGQKKNVSSKWVFRFSYGGEGWDGQAPADGGRALAVRVRKKQ